MKSTSSSLLAACLMASAPIFAQTAPEPVAPLPPPAPAAIAPVPPMPSLGRPAAKGPSSNRSSRVEGIDYAPDGSIRSVYLRDGDFIHLSPELARQAGEFLRKGLKLAATGEVQRFARQTTLEANSITLAGRSFSAPNSPVGPQLAGGTPPPLMPGALGPRPQDERGPGGPGLIGPPPPPPPPDAARLNGDPNVRPVAPQPSSPVQPPPPLPAPNATSGPGVASVPPPVPDATKPQP